MPEDLGALLRTHHADNRRRARLACTLAIIGTGLTVPALLYRQAVDQHARSAHLPGKPLILPNMFVGLALGLLFLGLVVGIVTAVRRGEAFDVHERGFVHRYAARSRAVRWADIAKVTPRPRKDNAFARWTGGDAACRLELREGRDVWITGFIEDAGELIDRMTVGHRA